MGSNYRAKAGENFYPFIFLKSLQTDKYILCEIFNDANENLTPVPLQLVHIIGGFYKYETGVNYPTGTKKLYVKYTVYSDSNFNNLSIENKPDMDTWVLDDSVSATAFSLLYSLEGELDELPNLDGEVEDLALDGSVSEVAPIIGEISEDEFLVGEIEEIPPLVGEIEENL